MPRLPPSVWIAIAVVAIILIALCVGVLAAVLRAPARQRIARWPVTVLLGLIALAVVPWLVVVFAPLTINVRIHGLLSLLGWILVALLAFALLVLLPLAALASTLVWWTARRLRTTTSVPPQDPPA